MTDLDVTREICPMTYVRTRLALDRLRPGDELRVTVRGDEPLRNVSKTAAEQGHTILSVEPGADGTAVVSIRRA